METWSCLLIISGNSAHKMCLEHTSTSATRDVTYFVKEREGKDDFNQDKSKKMHVFSVLRTHILQKN
jgi:hypothetical protein